MRTYSDLQAALKAAKEQPGFAKFSCLEKQILNGDTQIFWDKDVSEGCRQMFQTCWVRIGESG